MAVREEHEVLPQVLRLLINLKNISQNLNVLKKGPLYIDSKGDD